MATAPSAVVEKVAGSVAEKVGEKLAEEVTKKAAETIAEDAAKTVAASLLEVAAGAVAGPLAGVIVDMLFTVAFGPAPNPEEAEFQALSQQLTDVFNGLESAIEKGMVEAEARDFNDHASVITGYIGQAFPPGDSTQFVQSHPDSDVVDGIVTAITVMESIMLGGGADEGYIRHYSQSLLNTTGNSGTYTYLDDYCAKMTSQVASFASYVSQAGMLLHLFAQTAPTSNAGLAAGNALGTVTKSLEAVLTAANDCTAPAFQLLKAITDGSPVQVRATPMGGSTPVPMGSWIDGAASHHGRGPDFLVVGTDHVDNDAWWTLQQTSPDGSPRRYTLRNNSLAVNLALWSFADDVRWGVYLLDPTSRDQAATFGLLPVCTGGTLGQVTGIMLLMDCDAPKPGALMLSSGTMGDVRDPSDYGPPAWDIPRSTPPDFFCKENSYRTFKQNYDAQVSISGRNVNPGTTLVWASIHAGGPFDNGTPIPGTVFSLPTSS